ncbi:O-antigen ligase family protein [Porphyromonas macacae]|nr:O-antigen ligase family protein [Porphyromonas macacae]
MLLNGGDIYYIYEALAVPVICFFATFFVFCFSYPSFFKVENLLPKLITWSLTLQSCITLLMYQNKKISDFFYTLISHSELQEKKLEGVIESSSRFIGFGIEFFGAAIVYSFGLMFIAWLYCHYKRSLYLLFFFFNSFIGLFLARTSIVGVILGCIYIYISKLRKSKSSLTIKYSLLFLIIIISSIYIFKNDISYFILKQDPNSPTAWVLEPIKNFIETGETSSKSTDVLLEMWKKTPDNIQTWLWGDGYFRKHSIKGGFSGYYKDIDVGYLRIIYSTGIFGLLAFLIIQYRMLNYAIKDTSIANMKLYFYIMFLLLLTKGFFSFTSQIFLIYFFQKNTKICLKKLY